MREIEYKRINPEYYFEVGCLKERTMGSELERWASVYSERIAVIYQEQRITYEKLNREVDRLLTGILGLGIKKGDHVILQLSNRLIYVEVLFALEKAGIIPVLTLPAHRESDLSGIFEATSPVAYVVQEEYLGYSYTELAARMKEKYPSVKNIIVDGKMNGAVSIDTLFQDVEVQTTYKRPEARDIAHILLSGGTTGTPKLIARTHADYLFSAEKSAERSEVTEADSFLCAIPIAHNFAMNSFGVVGTFLMGATLVICPYPSPDEMLPLIEEYEITTLALVPSLASLCVEALEYEDEYDISSLRTVLVGGAIFERSLAEKVKEAFGCTLQQVFGTAEGFTCTTYLTDGDDIVLNTQGKVLSEYDEMRIVDQDLCDVTDGEFGELIVRSPYTIHQYYRASQKTNQTCFTHSGFYRTGDKARVDADQNLIMAGRVKEQINRGGEKIMPSEVEKNLCRMPEIREAAVVGCIDKNMGDRIVAFLIAENENITFGKVREFLVNIGIAAYKIPDEIHVIDAFPLTNVGKTDKGKLRVMAEGEREK